MKYVHATKIGRERAENYMLETVASFEIADMALIILTATTASQMRFLSSMASAHVIRTGRGRHARDIMEFATQYELAASAQASLTA
jgi:hypothetical protein